MYSLKLLNRQGSKLYKANATEVAKPRIKLEREGIVEYIALEERANEGAEVGFVVGWKWVYPLKSPVMDGLICWLDGRDGSNEEQTSVWVDRSGNGNDATLHGMIFDSASGWTGDGVMFSKTSFGKLQLPNITKNYTIEVSYSFNNFPPVINGSSWGRVFDLGYDTTSVDYGMICTYSTYSTNNTVINSYNQSNTSMPNQRSGITQIELGKKEVMTSVMSENNLKKIFNNTLQFEQSISSFYNSNLLLLNAEHSQKNNGYQHAELCQEVIIHSVKIYNRALTEAEIKYNYDYEQSK